MMGWSPDSDDTRQLSSLAVDRELHGMYT